MQCQGWTGLSCAVQMTANAYVCFYSVAFQRAGCKEVHAHFLYVWPKIWYLRVPGNPSFAEHAILMFTKDKTLPKPGKQ